MKIGLIGDAASIHMKRWSHWLRQHGYEVHMGSTTWPTMPEMEYEGRSVYDSYCPLKLRPGFVAHMLGVISTRSWVDAHKLKLVHGHYLPSGGFYARWSGAKHRIVSAHGSDVYRRNEQFGHDWLARSAINGSDYTFVGSNDMLNECTKMSNGGKNITRIPVGIDTNLFKPQNRRRNGPVFLSMRQTSAIYNPAMILLAFSSIQAETGSTLLMAEPKKGEEFIYDLARSTGVRDSIEFYPPRPYNEMPDLYNRADCGISIPDTDGSSTAMLECMSCGIPMIASDIPVNKEWIQNGKEGVLVETNNQFDLISKMFQICDQGQESLDAMGARARQKIVQNADLDTEMKKADQIYRKLVEND